MSAYLKWLAVSLLLVSAHAFAQGIGTVTYVYTDPQGTPLAEADTNGNITATFDYTPYGTYAPTGTSNPGPAPNGPGYTGHVNDPETNLVYMQARYYDSVTGHFISVDPAEKEPVFGLFVTNRYAYASNNPINRIDPDGRQWTFIASSTPIEPRPILETMRPNPLASAIRQGIRNPLPRTTADRVAELARQAGLRRVDPSNWKPETRNPWVPQYARLGGMDHLDDVPDVLKAMYHLFRFAAGHFGAPAGHSTVGPSFLPTVTVGALQKVGDKGQQQQQQQQQQQELDHQQQQQQQQQPAPAPCYPPECA